MGYVNQEHFGGGVDAPPPHLAYTSTSENAGQGTDPMGNPRNKSASNEILVAMEAKKPLCHQLACLKALQGSCSLEGNSPEVPLKAA